VDFGLAGQVAVVTGAAGGIGGAVARALAAEGCDIALVDSADAEALETMCQQVELHGSGTLGLHADVRSRARAADVVQEVVAHFGRLDILVCCAGITRDAVSWKLSESDWDDVLAVNLKGCFNYARAAAPIFRAQRSGRIVNIASINGLRGKFGQCNYAASKAGVIGLSKTLARELGKFGVTVNVVAPGMVDTALTQRLGADVMATATSETVLGRISAPSDIADAVTFLCSSRARQITGAVLRVDAGQYI
jgi:3-oxoacyl-[acyl-carrier protein] reductase